MTVVLDDHLLRDWMVGPDRALADAIDDEPVATTNLWYARLCKSAAGSGGGALLGGWSLHERRALAAGLVALPDEVTVVVMRRLAWQMGELSADHAGLSTLGAEAVASTLELGGHLLVSDRDDGPGLRNCCHAVGVRYETLRR